MKRTTRARSAPLPVKRSRPLREPPLIRKDVVGGPLSRELISIQFVRLGDYIERSARLAYGRHTGFTDFEWRVFMWACEAPPVSINELSALVHRGPAQVSRTVQKLVSAGLLHRANRAGGPTVSITPTRLGQTVYGPLVTLARERNVEIVAGLSEAELRVLDKCVTRMIRNALAMLAREQKGGPEEE
jgi:DNA-binding MarR family transcriptional regulator